MMKWFAPLLKEMRTLSPAFGLAALIVFLGWRTQAPPFVIGGIGALVVTLALAVLRGLRDDPPKTS